MSYVTLNQLYSRQVHFLLIAVFVRTAGTVIIQTGIPSFDVDVADATEAGVLQIGPPI